MAHYRNTVLRVVKWASIALGAIILLLVILVIFISTPYGQQVIKNQGEKYLRNKLHTTLSIGSFRFQLKKGISITDIYLEDQQKRKLLSINKLDVLYDFNALLNKNLILNEIRLRGVEVNLHRDSSSQQFNFDFIANAFALNETENVDDSSTSPFSINLGKLNLDSVAFLMDDQYGMQTYRANINFFKTDLRKSDLNKMIFHADYILSDGMNIAASMTEKKSTTDTSHNDEKSIVFQFVADSIALNKTIFKLESFSNEPLHINSNIAAFNANSLDYRSANPSLTIGLLHIADHYTDIETKTATTINTVEDSISKSNPFKFRIDSLALENNHFSYNDLSKPKTKGKTIDYAHLKISDLNIRAGAINSDGNIYAANIGDLTVSESSGFAIKQLKAGIFYSDTLIQLKNVFLQTTANQIAGNADIRVIKTIGRSDNYLIKSQLQSPSLKLQESLYFQPDLANNKYFKPLLNKSIQLNTTIDGSLDILNIRELLLKESSTTLRASAEITNLRNVDRMVINLNLKEFNSTRKDLLALLPKGTIPDSLLHYIPEKFQLAGVYRGSLSKMNTNLQLKSSFGAVQLKATLSNATDQKKAVYDISTTLRAFDLGAVLADTNLGPVNGTLAFKGKSFDPKTMVSNYKLQLDDINYKGYTYRNVNIQGSINHYLIHADINSRDPNAAILGNLTANLNEGNRSLKANTEIQHLNLYKLGFSEDTIQLSSQLTADFPALDTSGITGTLLATGTEINYNSKALALDTLTIAAKSSPDSQTLAVNSPFAELLIAGRYRLQDLPGAAQTVINHYVLTDSTKDTIFHKNVDALVSAKLYLPDTVAALLPGVKSIAPSTLIGKINTSRNEILFQVNSPLIKYGELEIHSLVTGVTTYKADGTQYENLKYALRIGKLTGPGYVLERSYVEGGALKGNIDGSLMFMDEDDEIRYMIPYVFTNNPDRPYVHIRDSLIINRKKWAVSKNNQIYIDPKRLSGSTLSVGNGISSLELKTSDSNVEGLPVELLLKEFRIRDITEILIADTALANGTINGNLNVRSMSPLLFTSDITIDSLDLKGTRLGNVVARVEQNQSNLYEVNTTLKGVKNDLSLTGNYRADIKQADLTLDVKHLDLQGLKPVTSSYLSDVGGTLKGALTIKGGFDEPQIRGKLNIDTVHVIYAMTGTYIKIPKGEFTFDDNGILFPALDITDSVGDQGKITGRVNSKNYRDFSLDLAFNAKNFEIVGRKKSADQGIYGPTNADINLTLKGDPALIAVEGKIDVKDESKFTYIFRSETYDKVGVGLVEFFDPSIPPDTTGAEKKSKSQLGAQLLLNMYINITPASTISIVLDELSGDHLNLKGNADLNFITRPGGEQELLGTYVIDGGDYELSIAGLVRRKFAIEKGSTINWSGDPLRGIMDITAKYETRISAGELVNDIDYIPGIDKQKLNFDVVIMLKNELLKPDISFKLDMDAADQEAFDRIIYNRIRQINNIPAELNKQVLGVLAFNQFIAENPFSSFTSSGGDFSTQAFNTAGKLLTQELTDLLGQYIKDVDINFELEREKDYTSGQGIDRTDLQVGLTKKFADNRLNVFVGSSFALEGPNQDKDALRGIAGDVSVEYLLTSDGRFRLKGYRLTDNDMTFQGEIVRTGVSFVVVLEFNRFRNMFKRPKKRSN